MKSAHNKTREKNIEIKMSYFVANYSTTHTYENRRHNCPYLEALALLKRDDCVRRLKRRKPHELRMLESRGSKKFF